VGGQKKKEGEWGKKERGTVESDGSCVDAEGNRRGERKHVKTKRGAKGRKRGASARFRVPRITSTLRKSEECEPKGVCKKGAT